MSKNTKKTSPRVATKASKALSDPKSSAKEKSLAGSALSQASAGRETGEKMEPEAARALRKERSSSTTKTFAGSVVSQSNKER
ncbi:MAG: hypothetical protein LBO66_02940 [Deltaproteobacteria bacterium]|jgi:hypothetical protein|nr:hypothetical protein [Deltaproteobacteria bacterium]